MGIFNNLLGGTGENNDSLLFFFLLLVVLFCSSGFGCGARENV